MVLYTSLYKYNKAFDQNFHLADLCCVAVERIDVQELLYIYIYRHTYVKCIYI